MENPGTAFHTAMYRRLRSGLTKCLFRLARSRIGVVLMKWSFAHMTFCMPLNRICETDLTVAFHHPSPTSKVHILIVPKQAIGSLMELTDSNAAVIMDVIATTQHLVDKLNLLQGGYRLLVNGGAYQDVPQLHFHLVSDGESGIASSH